MTNRTGKGIVTKQNKGQIIAELRKQGVKIGQGKTGATQTRRGGKVQGKKGQQRGGIATAQVNGKGVKKINVVNFYQATGFGKKATGQIKNWIAMGMTNEIKGRLQKLLVGTGIDVEMVMKNVPVTGDRNNGVVTFDTVGTDATVGNMLTVDQFLTVLTGTIVTCSKVAPIIGGIKKTGMQMDLVARSICAAIMTDDVTHVVAAPDFIAGYLDASTKLNVLTACVKVVNGVTTMNIIAATDAIQAAVTAFTGISKANPVVQKTFGITCDADIKSRIIAIPANVDALKAYAAVPTAFRKQLNTLLTDVITAKDGITVTDADIKTCLIRIPAYGPYLAITAQTAGTTTSNGKNKDAGITQRGASA
jgi:hypothetical protein